MKKYFFTILFFILLKSISSQSWTIDTVAYLPFAISNNAVCDAVINDTTYVYSFSGIDSTKKYNGINLKSYRYNTISHKVETLPDLPDQQGKIAAAASRVGDYIYIIGGYHVLKNGNEISSDKVHVFDILKNRFIQDAEPLPIPIDDHVQSVWKDSLIYIVTGWSNSTNVKNVQIFNPSNNTWYNGESIPDKHTYKSFGASGFILNDTIFYYGGAQIASRFPIQKYLRKGVINPLNPLQIEWSISVPNDLFSGYRMAAIKRGNGGSWIGGSNITYNYNGISYKNNKGVNPSNVIYSLKNGSEMLVIDSLHGLPMDLRGIGRVGDSIFYLIGGMQKNQKVSRQILKLSFHQIRNSTNHFPQKSNLELMINPVPISNEMSVSWNNRDSRNRGNQGNIRIFNMASNLVINIKPYYEGQIINLNNLPSGTYSLFLYLENEWTQKNIIIIK